MAEDVGKQALLRLSEEIRILAENNPCGWSDSLMGIVAKAGRSILDINVRQILSREELAKYLGVSTRTAQRRIKEGKLPKPKRFGHREITFYVDEVETCLKEHI